MKTKNVLMLPLLSATFLLSSCQPVEENSSDGSENKSQSSADTQQDSTTSTSTSSNFFDDDPGTTPDIAKDADKDLTILKTATENSVKANGFKTVVSPFKTAITGLKYSQETTDAEIKTVDWDALLTADRINTATTHSGEGDKKEDYNFSFQMQNLAIGDVEHGIGSLITSSDNSAEAKALSRMIKAFGKNMYFNAYYSGNDYANRFFYDVDNEKGKESNARYILDAANPFVIKALDAAGYSVYKNDNPENEATFELLSKGYVEIPEEETTTDEDVDAKVDEIKDKIPSNWEEIVMDFIVAIKDEYKDNIISSKTGSLYTLSVKFNDNKLLDAIDGYIDSLDNDWSYTFKIPTETEEGEAKEIVVTKTQLSLIAETLKSVGEVNRFEYDITYDENVLQSGAFKFEATTDKKELDDAFKLVEPDEGETSKSMIAPTNIKLSQKMTYSTYVKQSEDSNEAAFKQNLRTFAAIPEKAKLDVYPQQAIPEKKKTTE